MTQLLATHTFPVFQAIKRIVSLKAAVGYNVGDDSEESWYNPFVTALTSKVSVATFCMDTTCMESRSH